MSGVINVLLDLVPACPLCGGKRNKDYDYGPDGLLEEINRYLPEAFTKFSLGHVNKRKQCISCGLVFLAPRPAKESLSLIYAYWHKFAYRRIMADPFHIKERRQEFERYHLKKLESSCPQRGRLLDVGCGTGLFLGLAQKRGWKVTGIDFDSAAVQWAREQEGIEDIRCGVVEDALRKGEKFRAITMFDYLEHTDRPGDDLDRLISHLAPGGLLLIRAPNAKSWQARMMGASWIAIMPTHLSYFSKDVLTDALTKRGLQIHCVSAGNYRTEFDILKQRMDWAWKRLLSSPPLAHSDSDGVVGPSVDTLLPALGRWLLSVLIEQVDHFGGWFNAGNNLTVIARRQL